MHSETEQERRKRSREATERAYEAREAKESEQDEELKAAAAMERADFLSKEVKQSSQQMQNIILHMQQVRSAIAQLRVQLQLPGDDTSASVAQDEKRVAQLRKKIAAYQDELRKMRADLIREEMQELQNGVGVAMTTEQLQRLAETRVDAMIGAAEDVLPLNDARSSSSGFTLIEILVATAVFLIFALGIYGGLQFVFQVIFQSRLAAMETTVASREMEWIRHLPYDALGMTDGVPAGVLERSSTTTVGNVMLTVRRTVRFADDPFDGTVTSVPADADPNDYKFIQVDVTCDACGQTVPVSLMTYRAPPPL